MVSRLKNTKSRWYPTENKADADYADDLTLLANSFAQAKSLMEQETGDIGFDVNTNKREFMHFKENGTICD